MKELLKYLSYSNCTCDVDYREELGIVNGVCPNHRNSKLLVNGMEVRDIVKKVRKRLDRKPKEIV